MSGQSPFGMMQASPRMGPGGAATARSGRWLTRALAAAGALILLGAGWCALWYYAASVADRTLAGWVTREEQAGRTYRCGSQGISGFPFRFEAECAQAGASFTQPPVNLTAERLAFSASVYNPTVLVGELTGPLTVATPGQPPRLVASFSLAQLRVTGTPPDPDNVTIDLERLRLDGGAAADAPTLLAFDDAGLKARIVGGSAADHPVIAVTLHFTAATAPGLHPLLGEPLQGDAEIELRGLKDLAPKPIAERFRELQASGGDIEVKSLRLERADALVGGTGRLTVNPRGALEGTLTLTVNGLEAIVPQLGLDRLVDRGIARLGGANAPAGGSLAALDNLVPGLSGIVHTGASASVIDTLKKMGQPSQIDNKPAVALPLRFSDGTAYLGTLRIGQVPPLF